MKVTREKTENSQAFLRIEMEPAEMAESLEQSYKRLAKRASVPGFRKGKAPRPVLERYLGKDSLLEEALNTLLPEAYEKALKEQEIEAVASPAIDIVQTDPVVFTATVPLKPTVVLGDYHSLKLKPESVTVTKEEADAVIEQLRRQQGTWEPVERPADFDDLVTLDIESQVEGKPFINQSGVQYQILHDQPLPGPGFAEQVAGMKAGEEKEFSLQLPADYPQAEAAGKEAQFKVKVAEIKQQRLPKLDSEFAQQVSPEFKTLAALRKQVTENLRLRAEQKKKEEFEERVVDAVVDLSQVEFPPVLVEAEVDHLMDQQARWFQASGGKMEDYLRGVGKTEEELHQELHPLADKRVTRSLVLGRVAEQEKIVVSDAEIEAELGNIVQSTSGDKDPEEVRQSLDSPQLRSSIEQMLISRKTLQRLVEIAGGSAPKSGGKSRTKSDKIVKEGGEK